MTNRCLYFKIRWGFLVETAHVNLNVKCVLARWFSITVHKQLRPNAIFKTLAEISSITLNHNWRSYLHISNKNAYTLIFVMRRLSTNFLLYFYQYNIFNGHNCLMFFLFTMLIIFLGQSKCSILENIFVFRIPSF